MPAGEARQGGFTYVAMLAALAIFGIGLAAIGEAWSSAGRREREQELLVVGNAYARAIEQYYRRSPGAVRRYPASLGELLEDRRFVGTVRHLRRLYRDPVARAPFATVAAPDGGIMGVVSTSRAAPLRQAPYVLASGGTVAGARYADWKFVFDAPGDRP